MNLRDIVNSSTVLVDASVLLYARNRRSPQCRELLQRCESGAVIGVVTLPTLADFNHRCMIQEAQGYQPVGAHPARTLSDHPELVRQLNGYADSVRDLLDSSLVVAESHAADFLVALEIQKQHGLLTNDALNLAIGRRHGIKGIATAGKTFDDLPAIIIYKPEDISPS